MLKIVCSLKKFCKKILGLLGSEAVLNKLVDNKYPQIGKAIRETKALDEESEKLLQEAIKECKNNL